ncbi:MAG TPA: serine/threonine protein kinase [Pirellulales bacterium]|jgi:serine/threonine protein kinase|nr:serine/threonine protein kinase [Pirellulales bacterium]
MPTSRLGSDPIITSIQSAQPRTKWSGLISTTPGFIRRHIWVGPLCTTLVLAIAAFWVGAKIDEGIERQLTGELQSILNADVTALELWLQSQASSARLIAQDATVRQNVLAILDVARKNPSAANLLQAEESSRVHQAVSRLLQRTKGYVAYVVIDREDRIVAATSPGLVGQKSLSAYTEFAAKALAEGATVSRPFMSTVPLVDESGQSSPDVPAMYAAARIRPAPGEGDPVAVIGLRIRPEKEFTRILNLGRLNDTGDTYAFDKNGVMLSESHFDQQLMQIGLIPDHKSSHSVLTVELRDPGVDLTSGQRPKLHRDELPLTRMVRDALENGAGVDVAGYRDFRGVEVVGAWQWLPAYGFGVGTEIEKSKAYEPLRTLQIAFAILIGLLVVATAAFLGVTFLAERLDRGMQRAALEAKQLGQYSLEEKIGEGAMGSVYRGHHAMLRRPTAVKLLERSMINQMNVARFEREVRLTSQLNHPNTIVVYDYGRTADGSLFFAMEYLQGLSLETLAKRYGPQPDGRVIHILRQMCGSLDEAHALGLVHRDIKPPNIMLTRRGGLPDFAKLLDFGVAKAISGPEQLSLTAAGLHVGTPLYMAPESIREPESAGCSSDLYSLGAVGYFLLTGTPVFNSGNMLEILRQHVEAAPVPPSERLGKAISSQLEALILQCLAKSPADRPPSAVALAEALERCQALTSWTTADATRWWNEFEAAKAVAVPSDIPTSMSMSATLHANSPVAARQG